MTRVMIVEDEPVLAKNLRAKLVAHGMETADAGLDLPWDDLVARVTDGHDWSDRLTDVAAGWWYLRGGAGRR